MVFFFVFFIFLIFSIFIQFLYILLVFLCIFTFVFYCVKIIWKTFYIMKCRSSTTVEIKWKNYCLCARPLFFDDYNYILDKTDITLYVQGSWTLVFLLTFFWSCKFYLNLLTLTIRKVFLIVLTPAVRCEIIVWDFFLFLFIFIIVVEKNMFLSTWKK